MCNSGIYRFTNNINGKVYIGSTIEFDRRWEDHINSQKRCSKILKNSIAKHGILNFNIEVLEYVEKNEEVTNKEFSSILYQREQVYLDMYFAQEYIKGENKLFRQLTYNLNPTASGGRGFKWSKEQKDKLVKKFKDKGHTCIGRVISEETREKIRSNHISKEIYKGDKNPNFGVKTTPEKIDKFIETWVRTGFIKPFYKISQSLEIEGPIYNRAAYCKEKGWSPRGIDLCLTGRGRTYKGFTFCTEKNLQLKIEEIKNEPRYWEGYKFQNRSKVK